MISNNGSATYKSKYLSFINKWFISLLFVLLMLVIIPCSYLIFTYWYEMPIFLKIFWPILLAVILIGAIMTPLNGMFINKKGLITFIYDFRFKKIKTNELGRISFVFNEWGNYKYSATIKFIYKNGKIFIYDYSKQFRSIKNKKLSMSMYTIKKSKIDKICKKMLDLNICVITIIDKNGRITYQK